MPNCSNCKNVATLQYVGAGRPIPYCDRHLPSAFRKPAYAPYVIPISEQPVTSVAKPEAPVETPEVQPEPKSSKKSAKVEAPSEVPAEETPTETAPEEEPKQ